MCTVCTVSNCVQRSYVFLSLYREFDNLQRVIMCTLYIVWIHLSLCAVLSVCAFTLECICADCVYVCTYLCLMFSLLMQFSHFTVICSSCRRVDAILRDTHTSQSTGGGSSGTTTDGNSNCSCGTVRHRLIEFYCTESQ